MRARWASGFFFDPWPTQEAVSKWTDKRPSPDHVQPPLYTPTDSAVRKSYPNLETAARPFHPTLIFHFRAHFYFISSAQTASCVLPSFPILHLRSSSHSSTMSTAAPVDLSQS